MINVAVPIPGCQNVMTFCATRLNPQEVNRIIRDNPQGLSDEAAIKTALKAGDYVSVLKPLWAERDRDLRLTWLRANENRFHPVLPFERALAEFKANPTNETLTKVSIPHMIIAGFRNQMDSLCSTDLSLEGPSSEMQMTYNHALFNLVEKFLPSALGEGGTVITFSKENRIDRLKETILLLKGLESELLKESPRLPDPTWLEHYGLGGFSSFFGLEGSGMKPASEWNAIRLGFVQDHIAAAEKALSLV